MIKNKFENFEKLLFGGQDINDRIVDDDKQTGKKLTLIFTLEMCMQVHMIPVHLSGLKSGGYADNLPTENQ